MYVTYTQKGATEEVYLMMSKAIFILEDSLTFILDRLTFILEDLTC